jgi:hypothetical protein
LAEVRARAADALAPRTDDDPEVFMDAVDAVEPPAIIVHWDDPWLEPTTFQGLARRGLWDARLLLILVAWRNEPGPGIAKLEDLTSLAVGRLLEDPYAWPPATVQAPALFNIGGVPLLGARVVYRVPVTL